MKRRNPKIVNLIENKDSNFYYLLGLIASDGHLHSKAYGVEITVNTKDIGVLFEIQHLYGGSITNKKDNTSIWRVSYKPFYDYLIEIGITTLKSLTLNIDTFFDNLTDSNKKHFVRGVLDGDGGVRVYEYLNKRTQSLFCYLHLDICSGSEIFLETIAKFINKHFQTNIVNVRYEPKAKAFYIKKNGSRLPLEILEFLYSSYTPDCIGMHRKYYTFVNFMHYHNNIKQTSIRPTTNHAPRGRLFHFDYDTNIPEKFKRTNIVGTTTNSFINKTV
jgi:hypothetical protein